MIFPSHKSLHFPFIIHKLQLKQGTLQYDPIQRVRVRSKLSLMFKLNSCITILKVLNARTWFGVSIHTFTSSEVQLWIQL